MKIITKSACATAVLCALSLTNANAAEPVGVFASSDDGNVPANTLDNSLSTRWSANGDGQYIQYDLGEPLTINSLDIAFYKGDQRTATFEVLTSADGSTWTNVFSGEQAQSTTEQQNIALTSSEGQHVRIVGFGNSSNSWNSITEVDINTSELGDGEGPGPIPVDPEVTASASSDDGNVADNVLDDDLSTRWSANGDGEWLTLDLGESQQVGTVNLAFYKGDQRSANFELQTSLDGNTWQQVLVNGEGSGSTTALESFSVLDTQARYVRYVGFGNSANSWNSLTEMSVSSAGGSDTLPGYVEIIPGQCNEVTLGSSMEVGCLEYGTDGAALTIDNLDSSASPNQNFDLSNWKITYPDASEEFPAIAVDGEFYTDSTTGAMVFQCSNTGGSTTNSSYSRSELREMLDDSDGTTSIGNNWVNSNSSQQSSAGGVDGNMKATVSVDHVSTTYDDGSDWRVGRVIVGQIHASDDEPLKLYYRKLPGHTKGWVYMAYEDSDVEVFIPLFGESETNEYGLTSTVEPVEDGIELGEKFGYEIDVVGREMTVTVTKEDGTWARQTIFWSEEYDSDWFYFKAGAYNQNNTGDSSDYAQVSFYHLDVTHSGGSSTGGSGDGGSTGGTLYADPEQYKTYTGASTQFPSDLMFNYNQWKITLPDGEEIKQLEGVENEYFYVNPEGNGIVFYSPVRDSNGTTPNSKYIRSELREREQDGSVDIYWTTDGKHVVYSKQAITHLPIVKSHLVATQIHGNKDAGIDDALVLRLEDEHLFLSFNGGKLRSDVTVKTDYQLGTVHEVMFEVIDGKHYVYYSEDGNLKDAYAAGNAAGYLVKDGSNDYVMDKSYGEAYFKVGNYTQSNADQEGSEWTDHPDNYGEVIVYDFGVIHEQTN